MKKILFLVYFGCMTLLCMATPPKSVSNFYDGMKQLVSTRDNNNAEILAMSMRKCFYHYEDGGINLPNDFKFFDYDKYSLSHTDKSISSNTYVNKLSDYIYTTKVMNINIDIEETEVCGSAPVFRQSKRSSEENTSMMTVVKKKYTIGNVSRTFTDTVYTNIQTDLIVKISNGNGSLGIDIESLKIEAERAYYMKSYSIAYKYYEQIIESEGSEKYKYIDDIYYRLGLMTYWLQGCEFKFSKKKYAESKAIDYLEKAKEKGNSGAKQALFYIKYKRQ